MRVGVANLLRIGTYSDVLITTADPSSTPGALLSAIHSGHAGLTAIVVRRKGADSDLCHVVLSTAENQPVRWKESPHEKPEEIAASLWNLMRDDAATKGPGTYDVTLHHAAAEKGSPPKPIAIPIPVGHIREGVDASAQTALYVAQFCAHNLNAVMTHLPALVSAVGDALGAFHQATSAVIAKQQEQAAVPAELELARLENERERIRWDRLERLLTGPLGALQQRMRAKPAALAPASTTPSAGTSSGASFVEPPKSDPPEIEIVHRARSLVSMLTANAGLSDQLRTTIGDEIHGALLALANDGATHDQVLDVIARITVHPKRVDVFVMLDGPIADEAEKIADLATRIS